MVAIPEFAAGAMENWGLVTYRETDLLIDDASAASRQLQRVAEAQSIARSTRPRVPPTDPNNKTSPRDWGRVTLG